MFLIFVFSKLFIVLFYFFQAPPAAEGAPALEAGEVAPAAVEGEAIEAVAMDEPVVAADPPVAAAPVAPPGPGVLGGLLRANLAANILAARLALGTDVAVIQLVVEILNDPDHFQLQ